MNTKKICLNLTKKKRNETRSTDEETLNCEEFLLLSYFSVSFTPIFSNFFFFLYFVRKFRNKTNCNKSDNSAFLFIAIVSSDGMLQFLVLEMLLQLVLEEAHVGLLLVGGGWKVVTTGMMNRLCVLEAAFEQKTQVVMNDLVGGSRHVKRWYGDSCFVAVLMDEWAGPEASCHYHKTRLDWGHYNW